MSSHVNFLSMVLHVVHAPCPPISTALACLVFSSIMACLWVWFAWLQRSVFEAPTPWRPTAVTPTMSWWRSMLSAWLTDSVTDHFLPVRVTIPASRISSSGEFLSVNTNLVFAVLNSSTSEESGSCSRLPFPYNPTLAKLGGTPSHLQRCRLVILSKASIVELDHVPGKQIPIPAV